MNNLGIYDIDKRLVELNELSLQQLIDTYESELNDKVNKSGTIIVSVHADDEIYLYGSMMLRYPNSIIIHVPFLGDMSSTQSSYAEQLTMLYKSMILINEIRRTKFYEPIRLGYIRKFNKIPSYNGFKDKEFIEVVHAIEDSISCFDTVDYYVRTPESTHQNHTATYHASNAVLRSPYIDRIKCILTAQYPTDYATCKLLDNNVYQKLSNMDANYLDKILAKVYESKTTDRLTLSPETYRITLELGGRIASCMYAQGYHLDKLIIN